MSIKKRLWVKLKNTIYLLDIFVKPWQKFLLGSFQKRQASCGTMMFQLLEKVQVLRGVQFFEVSFQELSRVNQVK